MKVAIYESLEGQVNKKNIEIYSKYLMSCSIKSKDTMNTTYKIYLSNMKLFMIYLKKFEGNRYLISEDTIKNFSEIWERYASSCMSLGNNNRTINNKRTALSTFYDWCEKRDYIKYNPFRKIESMKVGEQDKRRKSYFLTQKQIWEINFEMKRNKKKYDIQDRILFNLFLDSASRISAIHSLKIKQLDLINSCFEGVREKEGYIVQVIFFQETKELIEKWIKERQEKGIISEWLFVTKYNGKVNRMSKETIRDRVRKMGKVVDIEDLYPHSLRKTIINIISGIGDISDGAGLAHHKNSKVTAEHYIQQKQQNDMRNRLLDLRKKAGL